MKYYEDSLLLLKPQGLIAIDNTIWKGRVTDETDKSKSTETIRNLNKFIKLIELKLNKKAIKKYTKKHPGDLSKTKSTIRREKSIFGHENRVSLNTGIEDAIQNNQTGKLVNPYNKNQNCAPALATPESPVGMEADLLAECT